MCACIFGVFFSLSSMWIVCNAYMFAHQCEFLCTPFFCCAIIVIVVVFLAFIVGMKYIGWKCDLVYSVNIWFRAQRNNPLHRMLELRYGFFPFGFEWNGATVISIACILWMCLSVRYSSVCVCACEACFAAYAIRKLVLAQQTTIVDFFLELA